MCEVRLMVKDVPVVSKAIVFSAGVQGDQKRCAWEQQQYDTTV